MVQPAMWGGYNVTTLCSLCRDYNEFLEDLEDDPSVRQNVNIYLGESPHTAWTHSVHCLALIVLCGSVYHLFFPLPFGHLSFSCL